GHLYHRGAGPRERGILRRGRGHATGVEFGAEGENARATVAEFFDDADFNLEVVARSTFEAGSEDLSGPVSDGQYVISTPAWSKR
ncbi:hypothetical protein BRC78_06775, partial [Halobacteriales archaeon QH_8_68_33]